MANPNQSLSVVAVEVNGQRLDVQDVSSFDPGGVTREERIGDQRIAFGAKPKPATLEMTIQMLAQTDPAVWDRWDDATVVVAMDTGQTFVMANSWLMESPSISPGDGTASLTFKANQAVLVG